MSTNQEHIIVFKDDDIRVKNSIQESHKEIAVDMFEAIIHQWQQSLTVISLHFLTLKEQSQICIKEDIVKIANDGVEVVGFMNETVNDFKSFYSKDKTYESFSVYDTLLKVDRIINSTLTKSNTILCLDVLEDVEIHGVKNEFIHIFLVLISNSIDAIVSHRVTKKLKSSAYTGRISISTKELDDKKIEIILTDNGGGIDEGILDRIFDCNFSTKGSDGSGLGLSIVSMLMSNSFLGTISVSNTAVGAKFSLVFDKKRVPYEDTRKL